MSRRRSRRRDRRGFAIFLALLVLLVLTIAALGLVFNTSAEQALAGTDGKAAKTFYAADSGLQHGAAQIRADPTWQGGTLPVGVSSNYPNSSAPDIGVTVAKPVLVGYTVRAADEFQSQGSSYGSPQLVEGRFRIESTASSSTLQSEKTLDAELVVYPHQLALP